MCFIGKKKKIKNKFCKNIGPDTDRYIFSTVDCALLGLAGRLYLGEAE